MPRRSVALLIETSNGYSCGLLQGVISYTKEHGNCSVYLTEQERDLPPPAWLATWGGDGIIAHWWPVIAPTGAGLLVQAARVKVAVRELLKTMLT